MRPKASNLTKSLGVVVLSFIIFGVFFSISKALNDSTKKDKKGLLKYKDGQVRKKEITSEDWQPAEVNSTVLSGDRVRTYQRSRAELELMELDLIRMAPETIIDVVKLYEETKNKETETKIALERVIFGRK